MQRDLRALAARAHEEEERRHRHRAELAPLLGLQRPRALGQRERVESAEGIERGDHPEDEAGVPDAVDDERLLAGVGRALLLVPEADQQVGAQPHALPADEDDGEAAPHHQEEHEEGEEVQVGEVADPVLVVGHVADRVDVDQEADARHHQRHHRGQPVQEQRERDVDAGDVDPVQADPGLIRHVRARPRRQAPLDAEVRQHPGGLVHVEGRPEQAEEGEEDGGAGEQRRALFLAIPPDAGLHQREHGEPAERQEQRQERQHVDAQDLRHATTSRG